jgi:hypothetical protein
MTRLLPSRAKATPSLLVGTSHWPVGFPVCASLKINDPFSLMRTHVRASGDNRDTFSIFTVRLALLVWRFQKTSLLGPSPTMISLPSGLKRQSP